MLTPVLVFPKFQIFNTASDGDLGNYTVKTSPPTPLLIKERGERVRSGETLR
jgi:hypothetical protein